MSGKQPGGAASRAVAALVGAGAAFAARKLLTIGWKTVTGKAPPEHPEDPQVALAEALIWGIALGATVGAARLLATRATARRPAITSGE
ncbi:MAG: DUF4235 domain-containing protein [Actinobacteria bacterium]|nr:DUF4235 domain-containing protein [Actinomycetota bacterium]MBO0836226.1 DUF4235 domain-containing protein [Actinomycetota bacterium]